MAPRYPIEGVKYRSQQERERFLANGDWINCTAGDALRRAALNTPEKTAVIGHDCDMTFAELDAASESVAAGLIDTGLRPGDRAMFQIGNVVEFFTAFFGCFKAGVIPVATLAVYREIEMEALSRRSGAKAFFVQADVHPTFDQLAFARKIMAAVAGLAFHGGVPPRIVVNDAIGGGEIEPESASPQADEEEGTFAGLEASHEFGTITRGSGEHEELVALLLEGKGDEIEHAGELGKYEGAAASRSEVCYQV